MNYKQLCFFLAVSSNFLWLNNLHAKTQPLSNQEQQMISVDERIDIAKKYIDEDKGKEALDVLNPLMGSSPNFDVFLLTAQSYAILNNPKASLNFYGKAKKVAKSQMELQIAHAGIEKMESWINSSAEGQKKDVTKALDLIRKNIHEDKGKEALELLKPLMVKGASYDLSLLAAQSYAIVDDPFNALYFYKEAYKLADTLTKQAIADSGINKMNQWLISQSAITSIPSTSDEAAIGVAKKYIQTDNGKAALAVLKPFIKTEPSYDIMILAAQSYAILNNPAKALDYFEKGYKLAKTQEEVRIADVGVIKMKAWLSRPKNATKSSTSSSLDPALERVRSYITENQPQKSLQILRPLLARQPRVDVLILTGQTYALLDQPIHAIKYYQEAYRVAPTKEDRTAAQFGVAKMEFWLSFYYSAAKTYDSLLKQVSTKEDYELALAGKVKSLAYMDRPMVALASIPPGFFFTKPELVVAGSQASLWSGCPDITHYYVTRYTPILKTISPQRNITRDLKDLTWQMNEAIWPNKLTPSYFFSHDSESFQVSREVLDYSHYWSQVFQSSVGLVGSQYRQNLSRLQRTGVTLNSLNAKSVYFRQTWQPTRSLVLNGQIQPTNYQLWNPLLWRGNIYYHPNDYIGLNVSGLKEVVETFPAFTQHISTNQMSADVFLNWIPYVKLNGALSQLNFTDTNLRRGYYAAASALILPSMGINLMYQKRGFNSKFVSPYYFSPNRYAADTVILRLSSKARSVWHYYIDGGLGRQTVTITGVTSKPAPTYQWGVGLNGPINNWLILNANYYMTTQASSFIATPNYRYQAGSIGLTVLL